MRLVRLAVVLTVAGVLAGCAAGWPISKTEIGSPPPTEARLVVYRPHGVMLAWRSISVDVNGASACDLGRDAGFAKNVGPGKVTLTAHLYGVEGESSLSLMAEPAKTYYVRLRVAGETKPGAVGGLIGLGSEASLAGESGPFDLAQTDEADALASGVKIVQCQG